MTLSNRKNIWIWSVTPENWEIVKKKHVWATKKKSALQYIKKNDIIIFYVKRSGSFKGIFEIISDWYEAEEPIWSDEDNSIIYKYQGELKTIKIGDAKFNELTDKLSFTKGKDNPKLIAMTLKASARGPSNFGKPIPQEDYEIILNSMSNVTKSIEYQSSNQDSINKLIDVTMSDYLKSQGYLFPDHTISQFYLALKTKGFVILSGLTGSGKTKLALEFAKLLGNKYIFLSVKPDWRDSKPLLGYYNPIMDEYQRTELLDFIIGADEEYKSNKENAEPYFIILDEMNLAHVEHYFSDFLSVLESGRDGEGYTRESIKLHKLHDNEEDKNEQRKQNGLRLPPNLYIIGTVNIDETTYMFSPKVLDRAFAIEFNDIMLDNYPPPDKVQGDIDTELLREEIIEDLRRGGNFLYYPKDEINDAVKDLKDNEYWNILERLNDILSKYDLQFGYRVVDEIALFCKNANENRIVSINNDEAIDLAILMKVLPKFHGNRTKIEKPLIELITMIENNDLKLDSNSINTEDIRNKMKDIKKCSARKSLKMLIRLYEQGFTSYF